jgi:hypothetical protein
MKLNLGRQTLAQLIDALLQQFAIVGVERRTPDATSEARQRHAADQQAVVANVPMPNRSVNRFSQP